MIPRLGRLPASGDSLLAGLLLAAFVILAGGSLQRMTLTFDEGAHYAYGWMIANAGGWISDNRKMPMSALNALPRRLAPALGLGALRSRLETVEFGRYVTLICAAHLGWLVFRWARHLYGAPAGLLALTLFVFDPNVLAHSGLVTTDLYAAWLTALTVWSFWRFLNHEGPGAWRLATASAFLLGLAQLAKFTCAYLAPILVLIAVGHSAPDIWSLVRAGRFRALAAQGLAAGKLAALYAAAFVVVANVGYWGRDAFRPLQAYAFRSSLLQEAQAALGSLPGLRVPVPAPFLDGVDHALAYERVGDNVYLRGQLGKDGVPGRRFPEYHAVAWLYKEPVPTLVVLLLALVAYVIRFRHFDFRRNEWPLVCAILFFAWYFTFEFKIQIGLRHTLVMHPLVFVFAGSLLQDPSRFYRGARIVLGGLLLWLVASVLSYYPHFLPYFNEFVSDRKQAYRILVDSNLDWGQSGRYVARYLRDHPDVHFMPDRPRPGTILLSVNHYSGLLRGEQFRWLRENFEPVGHVAYTHLLLRVSPEALRRVTDPIPPDHGDKVN